MTHSVVMLREEGKYSQIPPNSNHHLVILCLPGPLHIEEMLAESDGTPEKVASSLMHAHSIA